MALTEDQIQLVKQGIQSSFWNDVVRPVLANRANQAIKQLILHQEERKGDFANISDLQLKARIQEIEWLLSVWTNEIAVFEHNRRLEELDAVTNGANPHT